MKEILFVKYTSNERTNMQMNNMLSLKQWQKVIKINTSQAGLGLIKELSWIKELKKRGENFEKLFIGDYRSTNNLIFAQNINFNEIILLDDGTATFYIQEKYVKKRVPFSNGLVHDYARKLIAKLLGLELQIKKPIHLFTCYNLTAHPNQKIYRNDYSFMKEYISRQNLLLTKQTLIFVGAKYVEAGWMSKREYIDSLEKVFALYPDYKKIYIPHRGEEEGKLDELVQLFDLKIKRYETIIELGLLSEKEIPQTIIGFTSSALINIHKMYADIEIVSFRIPQEKISIASRQTMKEFYEKFEFSEQLKVVDL